jgi:hypothetical protein
MMEYWASGGIAPYILDLGTRWRLVVSFTPRPLYPQEKNAWYPLYRRLGGPQSRSGRGSDEIISCPLPGLEPPIIQLVARQCRGQECVELQDEFTFTLLELIHINRRMNRSVVTL